MPFRKANHFPFSHISILALSTSEVVILTLFIQVGTWAVRISDNKHVDPGIVNISQCFLKDAALEREAYAWAGKLGSEEGI